MRAEDQAVNASRTIGVVTVSRSDYGLYRPILRRIQASTALRLQLFVSGSHLSPYHGNTYLDILKDGYPFIPIPITPAADTPGAIAGTMGFAVSAFAQVYSMAPPDILLVLGDRYEMFAAAAAAVPLNIPIAHIHGGELSYGAIDEVFRHSMTKMAHLHFASHEQAGVRIRQMGEEPWRVHVVGAPGLDDLVRGQFPVPTGGEVPPILFCYHPVTREVQDIDEQMDALLGGLKDAVDSMFVPVQFILPNQDTYGQHIAERVRGYNGPCSLFPHVSRPGYLAMLHAATCLVGNSSSGIIEAASFGLPVVNVGNRQAGRLHGRNVIDVPCEREAIAAGIRQALDPAFRRSLAGMINSYGDGHASERIVQVLEEVEIDQRLIEKRFVDGYVPLTLPDDRLID